MRGDIRARTRRTKQNTERHVFVAAIVVMALMASFALAAFTSAPTTQAIAQPTTSVSSATHGSLGGSAIRLMKNDGGPITQSDVIKYVRAAGMPRTLGPAHSITVTRADLLTSSEISARLHGEQTGYPDNATLWFVEIHGTFVFPAYHGQVVTSHIGYQVFDPITGNLVMFGSMG